MYLVKSLGDIMNLSRYITYLASNSKCPASTRDQVVGAASQRWSNERLMVYFKLMMVGDAR